MQTHEKWKTIATTHVAVMSVFVTTDLEWKVAVISVFCADKRYAKWKTQQTESPICWD